MFNTNKTKVMVLENINKKIMITNRDQVVNLEIDNTNWK